MVHEGEKKHKKACAVDTSMYVFGGQLARGARPKPWSKIEEAELAMSAWHRWVKVAKPVSHWRREQWALDLAVVIKFDGVAVGFGRNQAKLFGLAATSSQQFPVYQ